MGSWMLQIIDRVGSAAEGVDNGGFRLGNHEHVAFVDRLPAADAGAVKAQTFLEDILVQLVHGNREVLPDSGEVHEPQVHGLHVLLATEG